MKENYLHNTFTLSLDLKPFSCNCCKKLIQVRKVNQDSNPQCNSCFSFVVKTKDISLILISVNLPENLTNSFRLKLIQSVTYRNTCGISTTIGDVEEDNTLLTYCDILLHEVKEIFTNNQYKYDHTFSFNHVLNNYYTLFAGSVKQNQKLILYYNLIIN